MAAQAVGTPATHVPAWHASPCVHELPSSHEAPSSLVAQAVWLLALLQAWQLLPGAVSPSA
jgi:hypothetical protein